MMDWAVTRSILDAVTWQDLGWLMFRLTAIAAIGHLILALLPRATAATRHGVALVTLLVVAAVPMASVFLPSWSLAVWPADLVTTAPLVAPSLRARGDVATVADLGALTVGPPAPSGRWMSQVAVTPAEARSAPPRRPTLPAGAPVAAVLAALVVAIILLFRVAFGVAAARWMCRRAEAVDDPTLRRELAMACEHLGVWEAVDLRTSPRVTIPVVSGLFGHVLLIPNQALTWSREKRSTVFLHEVAHLRRHDAALLLLARIVTASLWFHPLVWTLARVARRECERACDDVVLDSGVRASDYAGHLLAIAKAASGRERVAGATLAFSRRSSLEGRLISLLGPEVRRGPASRRAVGAVIGALLLVLLPLASVRVVAAPTRDRGGCEAKDALAKDAARTSALSKEHKRLSENCAAVEALAADDAIAAGNSSLGDDLDTREVESRSGESWYDRAHDLYQAERFADAAVAYERAARNGYRPATAWYNAACSHALEERRLPALNALKRALDFGFDQVDLLQSDSDLNSIRSDRRFQLLLEGAMGSDAGQSKNQGAVARYQSLRESGSTEAQAWKISRGRAAARRGSGTSRGRLRTPASH